MKKLLIICILLLSGCTLPEIMTANKLKDSYCSLPKEEQDKAVALIRKVFPDWQPICEVLPDIL